MTNIKKRVSNSKFGAAETFTHCWWECTKVDKPQKTIRFSECYTFIIYLPYELAIPLVDIYPRYLD